MTRWEIRLQKTCWLHGWVRLHRHNSRLLCFVTTRAVNENWCDYNPFRNDCRAVRLLLAIRYRWDAKKCRWARPLFYDRFFWVKATVKTAQKHARRRLNLLRNNSTPILMKIYFRSRAQDRITCEAKANFHFHFFKSWKLSKRGSLKIQIVENVEEAEKGEIWSDLMKVNQETSKPIISPAFGDAKSCETSTKLRH